MESTSRYRSIEIKLEDVTLKGRLRIANDPKGVVIFSHGSGSSRLSERNNYVANSLQGDGFSSLLFDLLTEQEDSVYNNRFDIALLTKRLVGVTLWVQNQTETAVLPLGYFGASTGAASALGAAAHFGNEINAVVSRGGRPDLAMPVLDKVKASTLLIIGGNDAPVIELNNKAYARLECIKKIEIVPGATHLFSEPGKLEEVAYLASNWFQNYLK